MQPLLKNFDKAVYGDIISQFNALRHYHLIINPISGSHTASLIFFHGSGDTGVNLKEWVRVLLRRQMEFPHIKVIYPTAPLQSYTPLDGQPSHVWFDRHSVSITSAENRQSLKEIYAKVNDLINEEVSSGIPLSRIIVGGFSMGGALALHTGYLLNTNLAGVFACSSFLNRDSIVYRTLESKLKDDLHLPELRMFHGERDSLVPLEWGQETFDNLKKLGVKGTFTPVTNALHELRKSELSDLEAWILQKLPLIKK